jgi:plastocyanin
MIRLARKAVPVAMLLALFVRTDAYAATVGVTISDYQFTPSPAMLTIGDSVQWTNQGPSTHTTTGDQPLQLWTSFNLGVGDTFTWQFNAAGIYPYHCYIHRFMHGVVGVKPTATPTSGVAGTQFMIGVSAIPAPNGFVYDVQMKAPGGVWTNWMMGDTAATVTWDSTGAAMGKYQFRSRLHKLSNDSGSMYSPAVSVMVTT